MPIKLKETKGNGHYTAGERMALAMEIFRLSSVVFKGGKLQKAMGLLEACSHVGVEYITFNKWLKSDSMIKDAYEQYNVNRVAHMRHQAKGQVEKALYGDMKLKDKEKVDIALRFLEKTDEDFREKKEIKIQGMDFNSSIEDLEMKAKLLLKDLTQDAKGELGVDDDSTGSDSESKED